MRVVFLMAILALVSCENKNVQFQVRCKHMHTILDNVKEVYRCDREINHPGTHYALDTSGASYVAWESVPEKE